MADISALGNLAAAEPVDMEGYQLSGGRKPFPRKGRYLLRARESFPTEAFGKSASGALTVQIDPTIAEGPSEGFQLRFTKVSNKTYQRGNDTVSQLSDYLKACGVSGKLTGEAQQAADLAESTAGKTFEAYLDWRLYAAGEGENGQPLVIDGQDSPLWPRDEQGQPIPYIESKTQLDEDGNPKRLRANLQIKRFVAASN